MAEQGLNRAEIHAGFQQVSGEGVSKQMRMNGLGDAGGTGGLPASPENRFHRGRLPRTSAGEEPFPWSPTSPVAAQQFAQLRRQQSLPVFSPFAKTNPQDIAGAVDVGDLKAGDLTNS